MQIREKEQAKSEQTAGVRLKHHSIHRVFTLAEHHGQPN
jgi:hypothetical protein